MKLVHGGLLASILYYSITLALETMLNRLFLLYLVLFAVAFWSFIIVFIDLIRTIKPMSTKDNHEKTAVFTMISGCTVLIWLMDLIPFTLTGVVPNFLSIYTTAPTVLIDIAIIPPASILGGLMLLQKQTLGYILSPIILISLAIIAVVVINQTALQMTYGVYVPIQQLMGYVGSFLAFGLAALLVNARFMLKCWPNLTG
jgi:hypothetical protein